MYPQHQRAANHLQAALIDAEIAKQDWIYQIKEDDQVRVIMRLGCGQDIRITVGDFGELNRISHFFVSWSADTGRDFVTMEGTPNMLGAVCNIGYAMNQAENYVQRTREAVAA